jgi:hypothetical protein
MSQCHAFNYREKAMRYMFLAILMTSVMLGLITWAARPELVEAQYDRITAPVRNHFAAKRAAIWQAAKDQAWEKWRARIRLPDDCSRPSSSLRALECKNTVQAQAELFERDWAGKVAGGWRPEGVD